jgi:DNA-binding transcriptional MerR regulator
MTIGQFSRRSGLTVKALRYYDRVNLIKPAHVDCETNFRSYDPTQLPSARLIAQLRSVDVPLEDIRRVVESDDPDREVESVLLEHRWRLEARSARITGNLHRVIHFLQEGMASDMSKTHEKTDLLSEDEERRLAIGLFNGAWVLLETEDRTRQQDDEMLHMAHAARRHWGRVGGPEHLARGEWQCSRVYSVLGRPEPARYHAQRVLDLCQENGLADFDIAAAYEALARAAAVAGELEEAREMTELALKACEQIADDEDRNIVLADLETIPGQPRFLVTPQMPTA